MSTVFCGCDKEANHTCERHHAERNAAIIKKIETPINNIPGSPGHPQGMNWTIKDSGTRQQFAGGMVRDVSEGKTDYLLTRDGPMYQRWAEHLTTGAKKYAKRNWMLGAGQEELDRAKESALRHFEQWLRGDTDEDHAAAVMFNVNQVEYLKGKL